jgi:hypothetical protein
MPRGIKMLREIYDKANSKVLGTPVESVLEMS